MNWSSVATYSINNATPSLSSTGLMSTTSALRSSDTPERYSIDDFAQRVIVAFLLSLTALVGIAGNLLVLIAVLLCRRLQTRINVFVVNIAVADLFMCLSLPFQAATVVIDDTTHMFLSSTSFCALVTMLEITCLGCSILTMANIAINRFLIVTKPRSTCERVFPPSVIAALIVASWLVPILVFGIPSLVGYIEPGYFAPHRVCAWTENFPLSKILIAPTLFIALLVTMCCYWKTYLFVRRHARSVGDVRSATTRLTKGATSPHCQADANHPVNSIPNLSDLDGNHARCAQEAAGAAAAINVLTREELNEHENSVRTLYLELSPPQQEIHDDHHRSVSHCVQVVNSSKAVVVHPARSRALEAQITKNLFLVVCVCVVCIVPFTVCFAVESCQAPFIYTLVILCMGSGINPLIYGFKHPHFRPVFVAVITWRLANIPQPSNLARRVFRRI